MNVAIIGSMTQEYKTKEFERFVKTIDASATVWCPKPMATSLCMTWSMLDVVESARFLFCKGGSNMNMINITGSKNKKLLEEIVNLLANAGAVTCEPYFEEEIASNFTGAMYTVPAGHYIIVDYNVLAEAIYHRFFVKDDKEELK